MREGLSDWLGRSWYYYSKDTRKLRDEKTGSGCHDFRSRWWKDGRRMRARRGKWIRDGKNSQKNLFTLFFLLELYYPFVMWWPFSSQKIQICDPLWNSSRTLFHMAPFCPTIYFIKDFENFVPLLLHPKKYKIIIGDTCRIRHLILEYVTYLSSHKLVQISYLANQLFVTRSIFRHIIFLYVMNFWAPHRI